MRHVIDFGTAFSFENSVATGSPKNGSPDNSSSVDTKPGFSLKDLVNDGRFLACDSIHFESVADTVSESAPGDLVIYGSGTADADAVAAEAMARGAAGILTDVPLTCTIPQCVVSDIDHAAARVHSAVLDRPDRRLLTVGVAGTAGKTTTALQIANLLRANGVRTGYQTDLGDSDGIVQSTSADLVPEGDSLVQWLGDACDTSCQAAVVEVSDDGLRQGKYDSVQFDVLLICGGGDRRPDYGPSAVTCALEHVTPKGVVLVPADDPIAVRCVLDSGVRHVSYGVRKAADVTAKMIENMGGVTTLLVSYDDVTAVMETTICGPAMAQNHAAAALFGVLIDQPLPAVVESLGRLKAIPGRNQKLIEFGHADVTIDAGGNVSRFKEALRTSRQTGLGGKQWCVLTIDEGCTPETLAEYGRIMERFSDQAVLTCVPQLKSQFLRLSHCVLDGVQQCASMRLVADQQTAVRWAVGESDETDNVLVVGGMAGKSPKEQRTAVGNIETWVKEERIAADERNGRSERNQLAKQFRIVG